MAEKFYYLWLGFAFPLVEGRFCLDLRSVELLDVLRLSLLGLLDDLLSLLLGIFVLLSIHDAVEIALLRQEIQIIHKTRNVLHLLILDRPVGGGCSA